MKWFNHVANQFRTEPKYERAAVRLDKLEKWIELQFKSVLDPVQRQLMTNFQSLQDLIVELDAASLVLSNSIVSEAKIHIHQLTLDHRKLLINSLHAVTNAVKSSPTDPLGVKDLYEALPKHLTNCNDVLARSQKSLLDLLPVQTIKCKDILDKIKVNANQASDIFEDPDYQTYLTLERAIYNIHKKAEEIGRINEVVAKRQDNIKVLQLEANRLKIRINDIEHDPRYQHEKNAVRNPATRYRNSFYGLDLQDLYGKLDLINQKIAANKESLAEKEADIKNLNIEAERNNLFAKIKKRLGIELELVD